MGKSAKNVAIEDGYIGGYGIDEASLLEGDEFELVGKCIFIYWGPIGVLWGAMGFVCLGYGIDEASLLH